MTFENRYSFLNRLLHRLSFSTTQIQIELASLEERIFNKEIGGIEVSSPVFITALPRAGTTLLLELCASLDEFASHCYRDMPFVLLPLIWNRFSNAFQQNDSPRERAHGDGMLVSADSSEAFEEMIWKAMWPNQYLEDHIRPWGTKDNPEFLDYFTTHLRKITKLRQVGPALVPRYISKNNANIARINWLANAFSDALFIVPFREVVQHAASLLRQHHNFLEIHAKDSFARAYMAGIGHFDFGENLRPINFDAWLTEAQHRNPTTIGFWVEYWAAAYGYLLDLQNTRVHFLCYEAFCSDSDHGLSRLAELLSIDDRDSLMDKSTNIRLAPAHSVDLSDVDPSVLSRAEYVFERLKDRSIV